MSPRTASKFKITISLALWILNITTIHNFEKAINRIKSSQDHYNLCKLIVSWQLEHGLYCYMQYCGFSE